MQVRCLLIYKMPETTPEEVEETLHYTNTQSMWASSEKIAKGNRFISDHQRQKSKYKDCGGISICQSTASEILEATFSDVVENHIVKHQLDSCNNCINCELNNMVRSESSIRLKYDDGSIVISLSGAQLTSPTVTHMNNDGTVFTDDLLPCEVRYRELNYNGDYW